MKGFDWFFQTQELILNNWINIFYDNQNWLVTGQW